MMDDLDLPVERYWAVCLMPDYEESLEKLKEFIGDRATFFKWEDGDAGEGWAVIDVKDHSVLKDLEQLDCVAWDPLDEPLVMEALAEDAPAFFH